MKYNKEKDYLISNKDVVYHPISNKFAECQLLEMIQHGKLSCYGLLGKERLNKLDNNKLLKNWDLEYANHICFEEEASLDDYENGYVFFITIYKNNNCDKVAIFVYAH